MADPKALAMTYFESWQAKDFDTLRGALSDDATFKGPLGTADSGDACIGGLRGMAEIMTDLQIRKMFVDGDDVITWFDLSTSVAPTAPTVNWMHTENGLIKDIRVTFDAREIAAALGR